MFLSVFFLKESEGVDKDGDQEHRRHWKVLQRQDHHRVRHRSLGRGAHRPEDPASERAEGGHRGDGPGSEETVRLLRGHGPDFTACLQKCLRPMARVREAPLPVFTFIVRVGVRGTHVCYRSSTRTSFCQNSNAHLKKQVMGEIFMITFTQLYTEFHINGLLQC